RPNPRARRRASRRIGDPRRTRRARRLVRENPRTSASRSASEVVVTAPAPSRILPRLLRYVARHKGLMAASLAAMIAAAGTELALPDLIKRMIDGPIRAGRPEGLTPFAIAMVALLVVGGAIRGLQTILSVRAGREIGMSLRTDLFDRLQEHAL